MFEKNPAFLWWNFWNRTSRSIFTASNVSIENPKGRILHFKIQGFSLRLVKIAAQRLKLHGAVKIDWEGLGIFPDHRWIRIFFLFRVVPTILVFSDVDFDHFRSYILFSFWMWSESLFFINLDYLIFLNTLTICILYFAKS